MSATNGAKPALIPAEKLAGLARREPPAVPVQTEDPDTLARRERLLEHFTLLQCELGGLYYEMAIRDSIQPEVLRRRAAELQRIDAELARVERILRGTDSVTQECASCGAPASRADQFCSSCGRPLMVPPPPPPGVAAS